MRIKGASVRLLVRCLLPAAVALLNTVPCSAIAQESTAGQSAEAPAEPVKSGFFLWTDSSISLLPYGYGLKVDPKEQSAFSFEHADENKIGDKFMFVDAISYYGTVPDSST